MSTNSDPFGTVVIALKSLDIVVYLVDCNERTVQETLSVRNQTTKHSDKNRVHFCFLSKSMNTKRDGRRRGVGVSVVV